MMLSHFRPRGPPCPRPKSVGAGRHYGAGAGLCLSIIIVNDVAPPGSSARGQ